MSEYAYSNFGYCVLGRIIEAQTGQTYEQFVRGAVLQPAGVSSMTLGGDVREDRKYLEVVYYGRNGGNPYGMKVARMDAHGGWIATASDLVRVAVRHGFCWAVLTNTRSRKKGYPAALDRLSWDIVKGVPEWPEHDLFAEPSLP